ncbi:hypothetical protein ACFV85_31300 [Streptomyces niveus]|uniref:hypothetical protein n=1 Tax=Streptomyces niveus TaxID=193462 RepID=UPI00366490D1
MSGITPADRWALLPAGIREQADGYVLQDARMRAIRVVFEAGRARGMSLHDAQLVVHERYLRYGDSIARTPRSPLDLESLAARAAGLPGRALAARLAVPFHFASPDTPDDAAPRRRP